MSEIECINKMFDLRNSYMNLTQDIIVILSKTFDMTLKPVKKIVKKSMIKSQSIQNRKAQMDSKVNLILNKLSESNIQALSIEFAETIGYINQEEYEIIMKTFYSKMLSEISFINIYLKFLKIVMKMYNQFNPEYFYSIIETKFKFDYTDYDIEPDSSFIFLKEYDGETTRCNNLIIIKNLVSNNFMSAR